MGEALINTLLFDVHWSLSRLDWMRDGRTMEDYCKECRSKGVYLTPALFNALSKYRFSRQGIADAAEDLKELSLYNPQHALYVKNLLEQIDMWYSIKYAKPGQPISAIIKPCSDLYVEPEGKNAKETKAIAAFLAEYRILDDLYPEYD